MSAAGFSIVTLAFPDPSDNRVTGDDFRQLNASLSFQYNSINTVRTLSTTNTKAGNDLSGLLYTPDPVPGSGCNITANYVPKNTTRTSNLPRGGNFAFIAIAPWVSPTCTTAYMFAAKDDPIRAFIFYLPDNSLDIPPVPESTAWSLGDGGKWKSTYKYPVYAIPGGMGLLLLQEMALYSGNITAVPNGHVLADELPPNSYVRLAVSLDIEGGTNLPSLWVFLLIVLGILMFIIAFSSFMMHWIHRRRRERLRRRIANGDVDLEGLGIRRLTVPRAVLDKMPLFTYPIPDTPHQASSDGPQQSKELLSPTSPEPPTQGVTIIKPEIPDSLTSTSPARRITVFAQHTCPICLDDFVPGESMVRELPCRHIFHPECVDTFLRENSSLCPLCKKTSLPHGYCPPLVTNAMVRRERMVRRMRERVPRQPERTIDSVNRPQPATLGGALDRWRRIFSPPRNQGSARQQQGDQEPAPAVEMHDTSDLTCLPPPAASPSPTPTATMPDSTEPSSVPSRQRRTEWARQRALVMVGRNAAEHVEDAEPDGQPRPRWRRVVSKIWPGLV